MGVACKLYSSNCNAEGAIGKYYSLRNFFSVGFIAFLVSTLCSGCTNMKEGNDYTVRYYTVHDLYKSESAGIIGIQPKETYVAICRIHIRDQTFSEQEFHYQSASRNWLLYEVRIYKILNDTLFRVEKADQAHLYTQRSDPRQFLIWKKDTVFTPVFFSMPKLAEYFVGQKIVTYDSSGATVVHQTTIEDTANKKLVAMDIAKKISARLKIKGFWANFGLEAPYSIRYQGIMDRKVRDTIYRNTYQYDLYSTNSESPLQKISKYFTHDYELIQEVIGWGAESFVYMEIQKEKIASLPDCIPVSKL